METSLKHGWIGRAWLAAIVATACSSEEPTSRSGAQPDEDIAVVYSVNYPLSYFAERIGGEATQIVLPVPTGIDPAEWAPTPEEIGAFQAADLILVNAPGQTDWVERASLPQRKVVDTSASSRNRLIEMRGSIEHTHGPQGEHVHAGSLGTTWLDPTLAIEQAREIADALARIRPEQEVNFRARLAELEGDLRDLDARFRAASQALDGSPLLFSHPVYAYFERRYGINGRSVHWEPGEMPTRAMWRELDATLSEHLARIMIWEGPPAADAIRELEARGIASIVLAPCANRPDAGDFRSVLIEGAARLRAAADQPPVGS